MRRLMLLFIGIGVIVVAGSRAEAQPGAGGGLFSTSGQRVPQFQIIFDLVGEPVLRVFASPGFARETRLANPALHLLQEESVRTLLGAAPDQAEQFDRLYQRYIDAVDHHRESIDRRSIEPTSPAERRQAEQRANEQLIEEFREIEEGYLDTMLPFQQQRLQQVWRHAYVFRFGMPKFVREFADELDLPRDAERIAAELARFNDDHAASFLERAVEHYHRMLTRMKAELPPDARDRFEAIQANWSQPIWYDVTQNFRHELDELGFCRQELDVQIFSQPFPRFRLTDSGRWETIDASVSPIGTLLDRLRQPRGRQLANPFQLDEDQLAALADIESEYRRALSQASEVRIEAIRDGTPWTEARRMQQQVVDDSNEALVNRVFDDILYPYQRTAVRVVLSQIDRARLGPLGVLCATEQIDGYQLTQPQKQRVVTFLKRELAELEQQLTELNKEFIRRQLEVLDPESRHVIQEAIGDWPDYLRPSLAVLASRVAD